VRCGRGTALDKTGPGTLAVDCACLVVVKELCGVSWDLGGLVAGTDHLRLSPWSQPVCSRGYVCFVCVCVAVGRKRRNSSSGGKKKKAKKMKNTNTILAQTDNRSHVHCCSATHTHPSKHFLKGYVHMAVYSSFLLAAASAASFAFFARLPAMRALQRS
jgi:hypothetical protein